MPTQKAPRYYHDTPIVDKDHAPGHLHATHFHSKESEGDNWWYDSQTPKDLDFPLPVSPPQHIGTLYIHRNSQDGFFQIWIWAEKEGMLGWQPIDLATEQVSHPKIPSRALKLTKGQPSWVLLSTLSTYHGKSRSRSRKSVSRAGSAVSG